LKHLPAVSVHFDCQDERRRYFKNTYQPFRSILTANSKYLPFAVLYVGDHVDVPARGGRRPASERVVARGAPAPDPFPVLGGERGERSNERADAPMASRTRTALLLLAARLLPAAEAIPFPTGPAKLIDSVDGTAFPPYRTVFVRGECTANDFPKPEPINFGPVGSSTINTNKTCFSCFRIPTLLAGSTPGVVHAFAEARRGELTSGFHQYTGSGAESCPDGPGYAAGVQALDRWRSFMESSESPDTKRQAPRRKWGRTVPGFARH
jgi:hypothetical protein